MCGIILWSPGGVIAKVLERSFEVSKFELQSCHYIYFRTNSLDKEIERLLPQLEVK